MGVAADFPDNKNNMIDKAAAEAGTALRDTLGEFKTQTKHSTMDIWRGVKSWFSGFGQRFDDFQCLNGSFKDVLFPKKPKHNG